MGKFRERFGEYGMKGLTSIGLVTIVSPLSSKRDIDVRAILLLVLELSCLKLKNNIIKRSYYYFISSSLPIMIEIRSFSALDIISCIENIQAIWYVKYRKYMIGRRKASYEDRRSHMTTRK